MVCILCGIIAAVIAWYLLSGVLGTFFLYVIAGLVGIATAYLCYETFCRSKEVSSKDATSVSGAAAASKAAVASGAAVASSGLINSGEATAAKGATAKADKKPATRKASTAKTATRKTAAAAKTTRAKSAKAPAKAATASSKAAASKPAAKKPATRKTAAKKPAAKAGPERLKKPRGKADDLKQISGVGPKLEKTLNDLGFWHFEQIAKWKKADVAVVDDELSFKGRIERDDWIKQAKALAKAAK